MDTRQEPLFFERIEDAIDHVIRQCGGRKKLAVDLWPAKPARDAHNLLDACLNPERREKLAPHELLFVMRKGRESGCHALMHYLADECTYERPLPRNREREKDDLQRQFVQAVKMQERILQKIQDLELGAS